MCKPNADLSPESNKVRHNAIYDAYAPFFNTVFTLNSFDSPDKLETLRQLYIFDRYRLTEPTRFGSRWARVICTDRGSLAKDFNLPKEFTQAETEVLSFLHMPELGKVLSIIGDIGTGKTALLQYLFKIYLPDQPYSRRSQVFFIDFQQVFRLDQEYDRERTIRRFCAALQDQTNVGFTLDDMALRQDPEEVLGRLFRQVASLRSNDRPEIVFVLDNIDPFPARFQYFLWGICRQLASVAKCAVVIAMRESTRREILRDQDGDLSPAFYIWHQAPRLAWVIKKRLNHYFDTSPMVRDMRKVRIEDPGVDVSIVPDDLRQFLDRFIAFIFIRSVSQALKRLSNCNVRLAMLWALRFAQSGSLPLLDMIPKLAFPQRRRRPHEHWSVFTMFLNSVGVWNHRFYFPEFSTLENVFSSGLGERGKDYFAKWRTLKLCPPDGTAIKKRELASQLGKLGYTDQEIAAVVDALLAPSRQLLVSDSGTKYDRVDSIQISMAGRYYLTRLMYYLDYFQLVLPDCRFPPELPVLETLQSARLSDRVGIAIRCAAAMGEAEINDIAGIRLRGRVIWQWYEERFGNGLLSTRLLRAIRHDVDAMALSSDHIAAQKGEIFARIDEKILQLEGATPDRKVE